MRFILNITMLANAFAFSPKGQLFLPLKFATAVPPAHARGYNEQSCVSVTMTPKSVEPSSKSGTGRLSAAAAATLLSIQLIAGPLPAWSADVANGATLFQANCAGCHAGGQNLLSAKKTLEKAALEKYLSTNQAEIQNFVQNGMPHKFLPMKTPFADKDYVDVTSYVLEQALDDKW